MALDLTGLTNHNEYYSQHYLLALFEGDGLGMDTRAARGTAFGLYNALCEAYEYIIPSTNEKIQARSYMFGERRVIVQRGFEHLLRLSRN